MNWYNTSENNLKQSLTVDYPLWPNSSTPRYIPHKTLPHVYQGTCTIAFRTAWFVQKRKTCNVWLFLLLTCRVIKSIEPPIFRLFYFHWLLTSHRALKLGIFQGTFRRHKEGSGDLQPPPTTYILISCTSFTSSALRFYYYGNKSKYKQFWTKSVLIHPWTWTRCHNLALLACFVYIKNLKTVTIFSTLFLSKLYFCLSLYFWHSTIPISL